MTINIGGEHLQLNVDFDGQLAVRNAEKAANDLYQAWRARWPRRSDREILAMVAYEYAKRYQENIALMQSAAEKLSEDNEVLERIISANEG